MIRMRSAAFILCAIALAVPAKVCSAQDQPVEQGVADVDPLAQSFRVLTPTLRLDSNFERVYLLDSNNADSPFYRRAGGLYAVFPQSQYKLTQRGVIATVPPGTVFHFGKPTPDSTIAPPDNTLSSDRLRETGASDHRFVGRLSPTQHRTQRIDRAAPVNHERNDTTETARLEASPVEPTQLTPRSEGVMSDAQYRARRLAQITQRLAHPERSR